MSFWVRILVTVAMMLVISLLASTIWGALFNHAIPGYIAGVIGGLVAVPVWELLKRFKPKQAP